MVLQIPDDRLESPAQFLPHNRFDRKSVNGLLLWLDASQKNSLDVIDGRIAKWRDISGNNRHLSQAVAAARPYFVYRRGAPAVDFRGSHLLERADALGLSGSVSVTMFAAVTFNAVVNGADRLICVGARTGGANTGGAVFNMSGGTLGYSARYNNGTAIFSSATANTPLVMCMQLAGGATHADTRFFLNLNEQSITSVPNPTNTVSYLDELTSIGAGINYNGDAFQDYTDGFVREVLVFDKSLDDPHRSMISKYLMNKWSL